MSLSALALMTGVLVVLAAAARCALVRLRVPPLIAYMAMGFLLRLADARWDFMHERGHGVVEFLMELGIIVLLFRIGLESKLHRLLEQLRSASVIWAGNVAASALLGYLAARYALGLTAVQSAVVATALTATSVGIPVRVWKDADALDSPLGDRFLDVAELDDITGVVCMGMLFSILPVLRGGGENFWTSLGASATWFGVALTGFGLLCFLFSRYVEERLTCFFDRMQDEPSPMLVVAGTGIIIAPFAGMLGLSVAIGAFFAGLTFSRDPKRVHLDAAFSSLYEFFSPFFFIGVGFSVLPGHPGQAVVAALVLFVAAVLGKTLGVFGPALLSTRAAGALTLAVSMVPRAEIAMVVMQRGHQLGDDVTPDRVFSAMVLVSAATCALAPLVLYPLLGRVRPRRDD